MSELTFEQMLEESFKESARGANDSTARKIYETVYDERSTGEFITNETTANSGNC